MNRHEIAIFRVLPLNCRRNSTNMSGQFQLFSIIESHMKLAFDKIILIRPLRTILMVTCLNKIQS